MTRENSIPPKTVENSIAPLSKPGFKARIVLEALRETKTIAQIASDHQIHPNLVTKWKQAALEGLPTVFERESQQQQTQADHEKKSAELYEQIGRLTTQVNWLKKEYPKIWPRP